jgi:putative peptidoglycan lipid II flippase
LGCGVNFNKRCHSAGVVIGGAVQALCQMPSLWRLGFRWRQPGVPARESWHRDPALRQMLLMMVPGTLGLAATQVNILVNTWLATSQGPGAVSWLGYAFRLMQFPIGIFGVSMAAATLPVISRFWVQKEYPRIEESLRQSLAYVFAINVPAAVGLAVLSGPVIQLIFEHGRFVASDTQATAMALIMYSIGLPAYSAVKVLVPAFYAVQNTRIPVISSAFAVGVTIALNLAMIGPFGYWGLALGTSIAAAVNLIFLLFALRRILRRVGVAFHLGFFVRKFLTHLALSAAMGGACYGSHQALNTLWPEWNVAFYGRIIGVFGLMAAGIGVWSVLAYVFRVAEVRAVQDQFSRRLRNLLSRTKS